MGRFTDLIGGYVPEVGDEIVVRARVVAHVNADWPKEFGDDRARGASDHDPVVSRFEF
jgi:hypothetical protein